MKPVLGIPQLPSQRLKIVLFLIAMSAGALGTYFYARVGVGLGPGGETWHAVVIDEGLCTGVLPRKVEYREVASQSTQFPVREWSGWLKESGYSIAIIPVELRTKREQLNLIENSAADLASEYDGYVMSSIPVFADGYEGRHQLIDTGSIIFDQYMFVVGEKAITAKAHYRTGARPRRLVEHFLASFRLNDAEVEPQVSGTETTER